MRAPLLAPSFFFGLLAGPLAADQSAVMKRDVKLFTDREYAIDKLPEPVRGLLFLRTSIEKLDVPITKPGTLLALMPTIRPKAASQESRQFKKLVLLVLGEGMAISPIE
jgi:hypothetical protein